MNRKLDSTIKNFSRSAMTGASACLLLGALTACTIDKTKDGELPSVDVDVDAGQLPEFDVETAKVKLGSKEATVSVPDIDVEMKEKKVEIPTIDIEMPKEEEEPPNNS